MTIKTMYESYHKKIKTRNKESRWVFRHNAICTVYDMVTYGFITQEDGKELLRRIEK